MRRATAVVLAVLALAACSGDDGDDDAGDEAATTTTAASADRTTLYDLEVGDCFSGLDRTQDLRVRLVDCDRRHQAEVYGVIELQARRYPGEDVLRRRAATQCVQSFIGYTGEAVGPDTMLAFTEVVPSLTSFAEGDRQALCVALGRDGAALRATIGQQGSA